MKYIITVIIVVSSFLISSAQNFKGGIMAGMATSQVDGDTYGGYHRVGLAAGGFVGLDISKKFAWQLEMKYIQKGSFKKQNPDAGDYGIYKLRLNYIEMPFMIKYKYKPKITFDAGLAFGYLAKTKEENEYGQFPENTLIPFHKTEISYQIGGYYQLYKKILFNVRYSYSFLSIRQHINGERLILFQRGQFNNVIVFSFYYQFNKPDE